MRSSNAVSQHDGQGAEELANLNQITVEADGISSIDSKK